MILIIAILNGLIFLYYLIDIIAKNQPEHPYVNTNNMWRFIRPTDYVDGIIKVDVEGYYKKYPQDLRWD